jgi:hypothetical protein
MKAFISKIWSWYTDNTYVRHVVVPTLALGAVSALQPALEKVTLIADENTTNAVALVAIAGIVRFIIRKLEDLIYQARVPEPPKE